MELNAYSVADVNSLSSIADASVVSINVYGVANAWREPGCKADWKVWQELNNLSGFAVNEFGVVVGDSQALIEYFEKHPDARKYRTKPLAYEDLHRRLFDGVIANGAGARDIDQLIAATVEGNSEEDSDEAETLGPRKRRAETSTAAERSRKKMTSADKLSKQVGNMAAEIGGLAEALLKDPQQEAIDYFMRTYSVLDYCLKMLIAERFESPFVAKLYLSLKPRSVQKTWVKNKVNEQLGVLRDEQLRLHAIGLTWEGDSKLKEKEQVAEFL
ncbi:hypothetical protein PMIN02_012099 [Paraphaeosphaeria minitans]|uniref:Uncharacterized protein n=1 Tax=Paraphaeosphaeria minitans TaxID=565426 RepID=A0A9P6GRE8_9PLEO|nr:hypothetical protein PMIN01_02404 [Paraphaeosphaeria minitans]